MRRATKSATLIASITISLVALTGCSAGGSSDTPVAAPENTVSVEAPPTEAASSSSFKDNVLTTAKSSITITEVRTIGVGEPGNEYGDVPVIGFWYDITNLSDETITPMEWIYTITAYQDNDPNIENKLGVGSLPDPQFLETQLADIKPGGTLANAVAYELSDTTTPVELIASDNLGMSEIGSMTFQLN